MKLKAKLIVLFQKIFRYHPNERECSENGAGFYVFDELSEKKSVEKRKSQGRALSAAAKENRAPSSTPRPEKNLAEPVESEQLRRRLLEEEKRRAQAEARASDVVVARKAAANAHAQLQSRDKKIEQLQKELEDTTVARKEEHKRACDAEADRGRLKKALYDKEQQSTALQKSLVLAKAQLEERGRKIEEMGSDAERLRLEAHQLRARLEEKRPSVTPKKAAPLERPSFDVEKFKEALRSVDLLELRANENQAEVKGYVRQLSEAQEGLQQKIWEKEMQAAEAEERLQTQAQEHQEQLDYAFTKWQRLEELFEAKLLVREVTLSALVKVSQKSHEVHAAQGQEHVKELEGALSHALEQKEAVLQELEAKQALWEEEKLQLLQEVKEAQVKHAEVCGELFTAQQVASMCREQNEELQSQLNTVSLQADAKQADLLAEVERLRAELYDALASRAEAHQALVAREARTAALNKELQEASVMVEHLRGEVAEADRRVNVSSNECQVLQSKVKELEKLRELAQEAESAKALVQKQKEELKTLQQECEEHRRQATDFLESMQATQKDMQSLVAEVQALRALDVQKESSLALEMERHAQSAGHNNHRQKIQVMINIKEDNRLLRAELKKARQRIAHLEVASAGEVASKIGRRLSASPRHRQPAFEGGTHHSKDQSLERTAIEYQHLLCLLQRAALNGLMSPHEGASSFLRRLGHMAQQDRSVDRSSWVSETGRPGAGPRTPEKRRSFLEDLSDLGDEVPNPSELDATQ